MLDLFVLQIDDLNPGAGLFCPTMGNIVPDFYEYFQYQTSLCF